jgi:hypothetical protein
MGSRFAVAIAAMYEAAAVFTVDAALGSTPPVPEKASRVVGTRKVHPLM